MFPQQPASSLHEQVALEERVLRLYRQLQNSLPEQLQERLRLRREAHEAYVGQGLSNLPGGYIGLDASRPWLIFWIVHTLTLLEVPMQVPSSAVIAFLARCQDPTGGFGGGPGQLPHLAPTYAAVATLLTLGGREALTVINRRGIESFLRRMCRPADQGGGFRLCEGGEVDVRGCYTAMAVAHMTGLDAAVLAAEAHMASFITACQTYEGGIGGEPGNEAHGGYAFCGLAAAVIADQHSCLDLHHLAKWATACQGAVEGGFMGRTNKLVDGCYSYWVGALFPLLGSLQQQAGGQKQQQQQSVSDATRNSGADVDIRLAGSAHDTEAWGATALIQQWGLHDSTDPGRVSAAAATDDEGCHRAAVGAASGPADVAQHSGEHVEQDYVISTRFASTQQEVLYDAQALQLWLLCCCQGLKGGLRDKPGKSVDFYHTCYCLSGLALAQHYSGIIVGPLENLLPETDLLCNVVKPRVVEARQFFASKQTPSH